jgi:2,4-dienoyl-CoA reductase (NADPH2)
VREHTAPGVADLAGYDGVLVATGVTPRPVEIPGAALPHVLSYERAIRDGVPPGSVAIIGGGGIGVDLATFLVESHDVAVRAREFAPRFGLEHPASELVAPDPLQPAQATAAAPRDGSEVTILRRSGRFGSGIGISSRWVALSALREAGVRMESELAYRAIVPGGVVIERADGTTELIPGNTVVVCAGQLPNDSLAADLAAAGIRHEVVGGARDAREVDAVRATSEGLAAARRLAGGDAPAPE